MNIEIVKKIEICFENDTFYEADYQAISQLKCLCRYSPHFTFKQMMESYIDPHFLLDIFSSANMITIKFTDPISLNTNLAVNTIKFLHECYKLMFCIEARILTSSSEEVVLFNTIYRVFENFIQIYTDTDFIVLETKETIDFFYKTMCPILMGELSETEYSYATTLLEAGILLQIGNYIYNPCIRARKGISTDWI